MDQAWLTFPVLGFIFNDRLDVSSVYITQDTSGRTKLEVRVRTTFVLGELGEHLQIAQLSTILFRRYSVRIDKYKKVSVGMSCETSQLKSNWVYSCTQVPDQDLIKIMITLTGYNVGDQCWWWKKKKWWNRIRTAYVLYKAELKMIVLLHCCATCTSQPNWQDEFWAFSSAWNGVH